MADPDNEGHSGWRIDQIAGITDSSLATYRPNVVTLMIGTNDLADHRRPGRCPAPQRLRLPEDGRRLESGRAGRRQRRLDRAPRRRSALTGVVRSGIAGKCLDLKAGDSTNGTAVQLWTCNGTGAQSWTAAADGTLRTSGKCLDVYGLGRRTARRSRSGIATAVLTRSGYEHDVPGDLVHVDIKKLGNIPDGGGHQVLGYTPTVTTAATPHSKASPPSRVPNLSGQYSWWIGLSGRPNGGTQGTQTDTRDTMH